MQTADLSKTALKAGWGVCWTPVCKREGVRDREREKRDGGNDTALVRMSYLVAGLDFSKLHVYLEKPASSAVA